MVSWETRTLEGKIQFLRKKTESAVFVSIVAKQHDFSYVACVAADRVSFSFCFYFGDFTHDEVKA